MERIGGPPYRIRLSHIPSTSTAAVTTIQALKASLVSEIAIVMFPPFLTFGQVLGTLVLIRTPDTTPLTKDIYFEVKLQKLLASACRDGGWGRGKTNLINLSAQADGS